MSVLTTALGFIITYLILSLIASGIQETIAGWLALRGKFLGRTLENMLSNKSSAGQSDKSLIDAFLANNHYQNLIQGEAQQHPSYLEAKTFASILLHILNGSTVDALKATIEKMNEGNLKDFLSDSLQEIGDDLEQFRLKLENWYNEVMARASGWYKRYTHNILLVIGFLLSAFFNGDSLSMYQKMANSNTSAQQTNQIIALAQDLLESRRDSSFMAQLQQVQDTRKQLEENQDSLGVSNVDSVLAAQNLLLLKQTKDFISILQANNSPLGLGWSAGELSKLKNLGFLALKILGLAVTAIAISLGAPFWFDLLNKFMNIRSAGPQANAGNKKN